MCDGDHGRNSLFSPDEIIDSPFSPDYYAAPRTASCFSGDNYFTIQLMMILRIYGQAYFHLGKHISEAPNDNDYH